MIAATQHAVAPLRSPHQVLACRTALPALFLRELQHRILEASITGSPVVRCVLAAPARLRAALRASQRLRCSCSTSEEGRAGGNVTIDSVLGIELSGLPLVQLDEGRIQIFPGRVKFDDCLAALGRVEGFVLRGVIKHRPEAGGVKEMTTR